MVTRAVAVVEIGAQTFAFAVIADAIVTQPASVYVRVVTASFSVGAIGPIANVAEGRRSVERRATFIFLRREEEGRLRESGGSERERTVGDVSEGGLRKERVHTITRARCADMYVF